MLICYACQRKAPERTDWMDTVWLLLPLLVHVFDVDGAGSGHEAVCLEVGAEEACCRKS